jgi:hypothetical protein
MTIFIMISTVVGSESVDSSNVRSVFVCIFVLRVLHLFTRCSVSSDRLIFSLVSHLTLIFNYMNLNEINR